MSAKVLVTERIAEAGLEILRRRGYEVVEHFDMSHEQLIEVIPAYEGLIIRSATVVSRQVIEAATQLRIIGRAGVGVDNIDVAAATEHGIIVCNAPTSNVVSAAEHTIGLMLACARNTPQAASSMHEGRWVRSRFVGTELYEKTLAVFGLGRVGGLVVERARAFGMNIVGYDPYCTPERAESLGVHLVDNIEEILPIADFITVHLPKTPETLGMFGPAEFAAMKDGVILVNTARGGIYNISSLADFVAAGKIGAAAIDVFEDEPCTNSPLHEFSNVILTPHLGASTREAQQRAGKQIAEYVAAGLDGSIVATALNLALVPPETIDTVSPYVPACQVMGSMLAQIDGGTPKNLRLTVAGALEGADTSVLVAGTLSGILSYRNMSVAPSNVLAMAKRHGIKVEVFSTPDAKGYASAVSVVADGTEISCTMAEAAQSMRIVSLFRYRLDIAPVGQSLVFEYVDSPGKIGAIGTVLGQANINITTMQVGVKEHEENALVYMNVEGDVTDAVIDELRCSIVGLQNLWYVRF